MYDGWLAFAGMEIANKARTMAYVDSLLPNLDMFEWSDCDLQAAVEDDPYVTPIADPAPWYDVDTIGSGEFLGFIPSRLSGFEDSTRTAPVMESTMAGGTVGRTRRATREMRVSGYLIGTSHVGAMAGFSWLKSALDGNLCNTCDDSDDVCFFTACPRAGEDPDQLIRHLRRVKCIAGPTIVSESYLSCGGYMVQVEFTLVAGSPYVYGEPIAVAAAAGPTLTPILEGSEVFTLAAPVDTCWAVLDKERTNAILRDPNCPPVPNPPTVPKISSVCGQQSFSAIGYHPTVRFAYFNPTAVGYQGRPVVAYGAGIWVTAYSKDPASARITTSTNIVARTSTTSGATWSGEYTLYDHGSANTGTEPAGITYAPDVGKFLMGSNTYDLTVTSGINQFQGRIHQSTTGLSGSWTVLSDLHPTMSKYMTWYYLTDVEHYENGTANGILYAAAWGVRKGQTREVAIVMRSLNMGTSWEFISVPWLETENATYAYPQLGIWPNGEVAILAHDNVSRQIVFKRSVDGARTWTDTVIAATAASGIPAPVITTDGGIMFMYRDMRIPGPRNLGRHNYRWSKDRGRTWYSGSNVFTEDAVEGQMGADWAMAPSGDIGVVFALDYAADDGRTYWTTFTARENYESYAIGVPDAALKTWGDGVMVLQIRTGSAATRQLRVRIVPRPVADVEPEAVDPCSICGGFMIDYAPENTVIYLDGMSQRVTMKVANGTPVPADHLVSGENGAVFEWPTFSCGMAYFVLLDVAVGTTVDVALAVANRE